jgi:hypothetical protein
MSRTSTFKVFPFKGISTFRQYSRARSIKTRIETAEVLAGFGRPSDPKAQGPEGRKKETNR